MSGMDFITEMTLQHYLEEKHGPDQKYGASHIECRLLGLLSARIDGGLLWCVRRSNELLADLYAKDHPGEQLGPLKTLHITMEPPVDEPCRVIFYRLALPVKQAA